MKRNPDEVTYLFFDAGGTLVDLNYSYLKELIHQRGYVAEERILAFAEGKARAWVDRRLRKESIKPIDLWNGYFEILFGHIVTGEKDRKEIIEHLWEKNAREGLWKTPVDGVKGVLQELRNHGYPMSVISNAHGRVAKDLEDAGLASYFEHIFDSYWIGVEKPDPAIFQFAMNRVDAIPSESLYVGDVFAIDIIGARRAGMKALLIDRYALLDDVDCPRIKDLSRLLDYLQKDSSP